MEPLKDILSRINNTEHGSDFSQLSWEKTKVDSYNATTGNRHLDDGYDCPVCKNKGIVMQLETTDGWPHSIASDCKCIPIRNSILRMRRSGLKDVIKDYTFDKYDDTEPWQKTIKMAAMEYAKDNDGWFFIGGQSGSGKTHICTSICRELLLHGHSVLYMLWRDEIVPLKGMVTESAEYVSVIKKYKTAEILYIDDLFKTGKSKDGKVQRPTSGDVNVAFEILNLRYNSRLPTIISSECTTADLLDIDEAVAGRILERARVLNLKQDRDRNYRLRGVIDV